MSEFKHIALIAGEIEGGFNYIREDLHKDVSLKVEDFEDSESIGEVISQPFKSKEELFNFMRQNWPTETTERCSLHIHFSFNKLSDYVQCMNSTFYYDYFLPMITRWGKMLPCKSKHFWSRLNDENRYCRAKWIPEQQIYLKTKPSERRYSHINFCWAMHNTFEIRLLPLFKNVRVAISATEVFIECIEKYLDENPSKSISRKSFTIDLPDKQPIVSDRNIRLEPVKNVSTEPLNKNISRKSTRTADFNWDSVNNWRPQYYPPIPEYDE